MEIISHWGESNVGIGEVNTNDTKTSNIVNKFVHIIITII